MIETLSGLFNQIWVRLTEPCWYLLFHMLEKFWKSKTNTIDKSCMMEETKGYYIAIYLYIYISLYLYLYIF